MSNYPPGVSGNEPDIAGYPERDVILEIEACDHEDADGNVCGWGGLVDATEYALSRLTTLTQWTCPDCGTEHSFEGDIDDGPDPDDERDRLWDEGQR